MPNNWPTEDADLAIAEDIIFKYMEQNEGDPLSLFDVLVNQTDEVVDYQLSDWVLELSSVFHNIYGYEEGEEITKRIVCKCITDGHTVH